MTDNQNTQRGTSSTHNQGQPDLGTRTSSSENPNPTSSRAQQLRPPLQSPWSTTDPFLTQGSTETIERIPRFQRHESDENSIPAHERTQLLSGDRDNQQDPASQSRDRARGHGTVKIPGLRYRNSIRDFQTPSPGRPSGFSRPRKNSIAVAASTGHGFDHGSQDFSLAGPPVADAMAANQSYVDPGYTQLNPAYEQPSNTRPVWGLAKPLPRVLRPGMVPTTSEVQTELSNQKQKQHEDLERHDADLEQDRVEATLRYDKIAPQLENVREEREIQLYETFKKVSPFQSPSIRGGASLHGGFFSPRHEYAIPEETEELLGDQLSQLNDAIAEVRDSKLDEPAYEDAVPLQAYEADDIEVHNLHTYWSVIRLRFREPLAELLAVSL
jgi:aquaglyceroporin related protein